MSLLDRWDPLDSIRSIYNSSEWDWFINRTVEVVWGQDQYGTGPIPMPRPIPVPVPVVISEIPDTWEEYEEQYPEYFEPILETRPGRTPDPYPQTVALPPPEQLPAQPDDEEPMAHDWGHLIRQGIGMVAGIDQPAAAVQQALPGSLEYTENLYAGLNPVTGNGGGGAGCDGMEWSGGVPPKGYKVVNSCGRGVLRKVRRRRRKRMLTVSDKNDIASIISMVGKGQLAATLMNRGG